MNINGEEDDHSWSQRVHQSLRETSSARIVFTGHSARLPLLVLNVHQPLKETSLTGAECSPVTGVFSVCVGEQWTC